MMIPVPESEGYDRHYQAMGNVVPDWDGVEPFPEATPWLPGSKEARIADLGCGLGLALARLHAGGYRSLEGVDSCPEIVRLAAGAAGGRARIVRCDIAGFLETRSRDFDLLLLTDVLEHFDPVAGLSVLRHARAALRPGGCLVVRTPNQQTLLASYSLHLDHTHRWGYTESSLAQVLGLAGFEQVELLPDPRPTPWKGWRPWAPWRGLDLRGRLNRMVHRAAYALRDQRPLPTRFAINLEAMARVGQGGDS